jgi:hypothetical protein
MACAPCPLPPDAGEGTDAGEDVPAVLTAGHLGPVDDDLKEQVVDVGLWVGRGRDDGHLAGERVRTAQTVDLPLVGAGGARCGRRDGQAITFSSWAGVRSTACGRRTDAMVA